MEDQQNPTPEAEVEAQEEQTTEAPAEHKSEGHEHKEDGEMESGDCGCA